MIINNVIASSKPTFTVGNKNIESTEESLRFMTFLSNHRDAFEVKEMIISQKNIIPPHLLRSYGPVIFSELTGKPFGSGYKNY